MNKRSKIEERLLAACKKAMYCLTAETEEEWQKSQAYKEAPYHFLYLAIIDAETKKKSQ